MAYPTSDTTLRTGVVAALVSASTMAGSRVEDSRSSAYTPEETYPRLNVHTPDVTVSLGIGTPGHEKRVVTLVVVGTIQTAIEAGETSAEVTAALAAALDTFEQQITHTVIRWGADNQLDGLSIRSASKGINSETSKLHGQAGVAFEVTYQRAIAWPEPTNALAVLGLDVDLVVPAGGPEGRIEASTEVDFTG